MDSERIDGPAPAPTTARIVVLLLAGAAFILGSFLTWISLGELGDIAEQLGQELPATAGINLDFDIFYSVSEDPTGASFFASAGMITIAIGIIALLGILIPWLARLAGALGIIAFVLFVVTLYRAPGEGAFQTGIGNVGIGMWLVLAGGILALIGGFLVGRRTVVTTTTAPPPEP